MDLNTGVCRVLWARVKWAGAPTIAAILELSRILEFLAAFLCVHRQDRDASAIRRNSLFLLLFALAAGNPDNAFGGDNFPGTTITGASGNLIASNTTATAEAGEPTTYGGGNLDSMWYSWTAPSDGVFTVETCSATQTTFDTTLQTFTGSSVGSLTLEATNDDACAHTSGTYASRNTLPVTSGTVYRVQVDGYASNTGTFRLSWNFVPGGSGPANDDFPGTTISGFSGSLAGSNLLATSQSGEPTTYGGGSLDSVWYSWTAPANGTVTFDTCSGTSTNFDTTIQGFTGSAVNALTLTATNDDACAATVGTRASSISFSATSGTVYRIQVDGYASNTGDFLFNWNLVATGINITKSVDLASVSAPGTLTYTIQVINNSGQTHSSPSVTDALTQGGSPRTLTSGPTYVSGDSDSDGRVDNGETWTYTATYDVTQSDIDNAGTFSNVATFNSTRGSTPVSSPAVTTTITVSPSLSVTKLADDTTEVTAGQVITYTYTITNDGNQTISNISLADVHGGGGTAPAPDADTATLTDNGTIGDSTNPTTGDSDWDTLAPGDVLTVTATYTITQNDVDTLQ